MQINHIKRLVSASCVAAADTLLCVYPHTRILVVMERAACHIPVGASLFSLREVLEYRDLRLDLVDHCHWP